ncbi:hypothetical protein B296_00053582, partial [Ensete ventricosum]
CGRKGALQPVAPASAALVGCCPYERCRPPLQAIAPASGTGLPCGVALAAASRPLVEGLGYDLAVGGRPCIGAGRGWRPLLLATFAMKTQQECIERFYMIQSHHTQFKINLSHENLGSDTTVGKPQWEHHMYSGNRNKNWFPMQIKSPCKRFGSQKKS